MSKKFKGEAIKNLRILAGKTLADVAKECGFDKSSLSKWENGSKPGPRNLKRLSKLYQVPIASFFILLFFVSAAFASGASIPVQTIYGEARGECMDGKIAVGEVIRNRVRAQSWYGHDAAGVCLKPLQFSFWNDSDTALRTIQKATDDALEVCRAAWVASERSTLVDGATLYCRYDTWPDWRTSRKTKYVCRIGDHVFYREK